jgi:hypothetical protein
VIAITFDRSSGNKLAADRNKFAVEMAAPLTVTSRLTGKLRT